MVARFVWRGDLIVFEGCDGAGKTTAAEGFVRRLKEDGIEVVHSFEPTKDSSWGIAVREAITSGNRMAPTVELQYFMEDRNLHVIHKIKPALNVGKTVVLDRYYFSNAVFQGIRGLDVDAILADNEKFAPIPSMVFLLDIDPEVAKERMSDRDGFEPENQAVIRRRFLEIAKARDNFVVVQTSYMGEEEVVDLIYRRYLVKRS
jgi:dTMP kinase